MTNQPIWTPTPERVHNSLLYQFVRQMETKTGFSFPDYDSLHRWSVEHTEQFWPAFWDFAGIKGDQGDIVIDDPNRMEAGARFFPNGRINYTENMLHRSDDGEAMVFWGEDKAKRRMTWRELNNRVSQAQQMLHSMGIGFGDRVAALLPNTPEAIVALLACANLGVIFTTASPDFGVQGVIDRFGQIEPKLLLASDGYFYNGKWFDITDKAREIGASINCAVQTVHYDGSWPALDEFTAKPLTFTRHPFNHPLYILFSSGTTGVPKCIAHSTGGVLLQHVKEHQLQCDVHKNDRAFYFTTISWMMWHWLTSALISDAVILLYDGSPFLNDGRILFELAQTERMTHFGTSAKFVDALRKVDWVPKDEYDLSTIRMLGSTGSPLVHESYDYIHASIKQDIHINSLSGGTDIVSCFLIGNPLSPVYRGELQAPGLGYDIVAMDDHSHVLGKGGGQGELVCRKPFPCMPTGFWGDTDNTKYNAAYFDNLPNVWCHGDWLEQTENGGFIIYGRSDATLNPGGVRIGTAEIYRQVEQIPEVQESIAVGQDWDHDVRVILFVVMKAGYTLNDDIEKRIRQQIKIGASPRHVPAKIVQVPAIPRTRSGKIVELAVRDVIHNRVIKNIEALANPEALDFYQDLEALKVG